ncbi:DNA endonuclease RBBP8-like [Polyodon spathula]|uniref:DNA endonuclease RBBP8-like n=1 Tax=Polyodon spathula TaxID=7913 RepID=UPI001B7EE2BA|nr:DNA endonuclease RBBP8-like [Polyodon spathula]XP_041103665.1 DNA endonuclease RBBP8-like [Polyodon spathula]
MNSTTGSCGSPSSGVSAEPPSDLFRDLWSKLKDCHDNKVQGLQDKISKLKKERCLDAQRLEEFFTKNQQLREHQKSLQDNVKVLEDRLRAGLCDRCAVTEDHMRKKQVEFENIRQQNLKLITELMNERNNIQDENKKLCQQLEHFSKLMEEKSCRAGEILDQEDGVIPDSPVKPASLSMVSRLRRKKENKHVRYSEKPTANSETSPTSDEQGNVGLFSLIQAGNGKDILVPETCDLEFSPNAKNLGSGCFSDEKPGLNLVTIVAETLGLGIHGDSESQSVLNNFVKDAALISRDKQDGDSRRHQTTESLQLKEKSSGFTCGSLNSTKNRHWLSQQRTSPVFGGPVSALKSPPKLDENRSPSLFGHLQIAPLFSRVRSQTEDVARISPLKTGTANNQCPRKNRNELSQFVKDKERVSNPAQELVESGEGCLSSKQTGNCWGKRKKSEAGHASDRNSTFWLNSEDNPPDKPLDLSDRPVGGHSQERREGKGAVEDSLKQSTLFDMLKASVKASPPPFQDENLKKKAEMPSFQVQATPRRSKVDMGQLIGNIRTPDVQEPIRKKSRALTRDSESASVLQPNPCALAKRSPPPKDGKNSNTNDMTWSLDPGADLSQYQIDVAVTDPKDGTPSKPDGETVDMDCTFVNDSMLLNMRKQKAENTFLGVGQKANDSLAEIFDQTAYGEYESCPQDDSEQSDQEDGSLDEETEADGSMNRCKEETDETKQKAFVEPYPKKDERKNASLNFPHVEVVRNKEERRKMHGHTCKECEIYYADLPEEERQKKLSACSRHRFRYIPPSTPENFWEVGFPSTQTCVDRGYIKEEMIPAQRTRRRRPYNAVFSPKDKEQKT